MKLLPTLGTSARPGTIVTRLAQHLGGWILKSAATTAGERPARPVSLQLSRGEVSRIGRTEGIAEIRVLTGAVWLTGTPASGDIVLRASGRFPLPSASPFVIEALQEASVLLVPHRPRPAR